MNFLYEVITLIVGFILFIGIVYKCNERKEEKLLKAKHKAIVKRAYKQLKEIN